MDPVTDIFETMHVSSVIHSRLEVTAPWGLKREAALGEKVMGAASSMGGPSQLAHFGVVSRGNCSLTVEGILDPLSLTGGDCFLLAPGSAYVLSDNPRTRPRSFCEVLPRDNTHVIHYGGGGAATTIISGWFRFSVTTVKFLNRLLPKLILVKADQAQSLALHTTLRLLAAEMTDASPGSDVVLNRLADILFIQCVRAHISSSSDTCKSGWLRAIFDPQIGAALKAMHERVDAPWSVKSLATAAGMSRSSFAQRFKDVVGETPLEYLTNWRMHKAIGLLQQGERKLIEVAKSTGYDTDAAFSKAFKRVMGVAPKAYRRSGREMLGF